jgi:hypothetical protein
MQVTINNFISKFFLNNFNKIFIQIFILLKSINFSLKKYEYLLKYNIITNKIQKMKSV